jgi:hypothetical protein
MLLVLVADAAVQLGVFRPPRLQPRITVTIGEDAGDADAAATGATGLLSTAGQSQFGSTMTKALLTGKQDSSSSTLKSTGAAAAGGGSGGAAAGAAKFAGHLRYYCRLLVNGHVVGTTEAVNLKEDFTLEFRDVFRWVLTWHVFLGLPHQTDMHVPAGNPKQHRCSVLTVHVAFLPRGYSLHYVLSLFWMHHNAVKHSMLAGSDGCGPLAVCARLMVLNCCSIRVYQWPKSVQLQLWQKGKVTDTQLAEMYVVVPGLHGTPHVDPQAKPYSWTCPAAVPAHRLARAAALAQAGITPGATLLATNGRSDREARTALHPSGVVHVRCGWVADPGVQGHFSPFSTAGGVTGVTKAMLESSQLASGGATAQGADGLVQLTINPRTGRPTAAAGTGMDGTVLPGFSSSSPGRPGAAGTTYGDTLRLKDATAGSSRDSPSKATAAAAGAGKVTLYGNPLAAGEIAQAPTPRSALLCPV